MTEPDTITLWRAVGQHEFDLLASSGWSAWPHLPDRTFSPAAVPDRRHAERMCRERIVPAEGVGYVVRFDVARRFRDRFGESGTVTGLNPHIVGAIIEEADYRGPVGDTEFAEAEKVLGRPLPGAWRDYLQGGSWFRRGWMDNTEAYVWLNPPGEMLELHEAWEEATGLHPGIAIIGGNGSREQLALDLREDPAPVLMVDTTSTGWDTGIPQAENVSELIDRIERGVFEFSFGD